MPTPASQTLDALTTLCTSVLEWNERLDELNGQIAQRQIELARLEEYYPSTPSLRNKGSTESLRPRDGPAETQEDQLGEDKPMGTELQSSSPPKGPKRYGHAGQRPISSTLVKTAAQTGAALTHPSQIFSSTPKNSPPPNARQSSNPSSPAQAQSGPAKLQKRKQDSILSGDSVAPKYRTKSMIIVYYDNAVQSTFEELVKFVSGSRNAMRKEKMAARMAEMRRAAETGSDGLQADGLRKMLNANVIKRSTEPEQNIFEKIDKSLEWCQGHCEFAAHMFLREGECSTEIGSIKNKLSELRSCAEKEIERLKAEESSGPPKKQPQNERKRGDETPFQVRKSLLEKMEAPEVDKVSLNKMEIDDESFEDIDIDYIGHLTTNPLTTNPVAKNTDKSAKGGIDIGITGTESSAEKPGDDAAKGTHRRSALIKPDLVQTTDDVGYQLRAPDLFIQNPNSYFEDINRLQEKIYNLGKDCLSHIQREGNIHLLPLPAISCSVPIEAQIKTLVTINLEIASSIASGLIYLVECAFCQSTYNTIVVQSTRPFVLQVIPIDMETLRTLVSLHEEAKTYCDSNIEWALLEQTLEDLSEAIHLILQHLGLDFGVTLENKTLEERLIQSCRLASSTLSVLFLSLVSFVTSHISAIEMVSKQDTITRLHIETLARPIIMEPRRLECLDSFVQRPVWTFSIAQEHSFTPTNLQAETYYLSIFLADFADLWGPLGLQYFDEKQTLIEEISVRGGVIRSSDFRNSHVQPSPGETMCHWFGWMDSKTNDANSNLPLISATNRLLIGGPRRNLDSSLFLISDVCRCGITTRYSSSYSAFELETKKSSWKLDTRTAQISGGTYANVTYGKTWKFNLAWTLKDVIVQSWIEAARSDSSHLPLPFYLDYLVVLDISRCTGHSRRTTIWKTLKHQTVTLRSHLTTLLDSATLKDFDIIVQYFPPSASFAEIWNSLTSEGRIITTKVVRALLGILRSTGVTQDGRLQAWDITSKDRLDGRRLDPHWTSMVKDDVACATFAIITDRCMVYIPRDWAMLEESNEPNERRYSVLCTTICITIHEPLFDKTSRNEYPYKGAPSRIPESERIDPSWSLSDQEFEVWKVQKLSRLPSRPGSQTRPKTPFELARDASQPDPLSMQRLRDRQSTRKKAAVCQTSSNPEIIRKTSNRGLGREATDQSAKAKEHGDQSRPPRKNSKPTPPPTKDVLCDVSFHFKNGNGEKIGQLILEPSQGQATKIDLNALSDRSSVSAKWKEQNLGFIASMQAKEEALEKRMISWTEKNPKGILPWAITHAVTVNKPAPFIVEYIRGGDLDACQKVLQAYIR